MGFVIGRISRSLKKQSSKAAIKYGESVSILDETLSGLRIIKAFNAENLLRSKFFKVNDDLLHAKNHIGYRRDLASPVSEVTWCNNVCYYFMVWRQRYFKRKNCR